MKTSPFRCRLGLATSFLLLVALLLPGRMFGQSGIETATAINQKSNEYLLGAPQGDPVKNLIVQNFLQPVLESGKTHPTDGEGVDKNARRLLAELLQKNQNRPNVRIHLEKLRNNLWPNGQPNYFGPGSQPFEGTPTPPPPKPSVSTSDNQLQDGTVIEVTGNPTLIQASPGGAVVRPGKCKCREITFTVSVTKNGTTTSETVSSEKFEGGTSKVELENPALANGDEISVKISDIQVDCPCSVGGDCENFPSRKTGGADTTQPGKVNLEPGDDGPENDADSSSDNWQCTRTDTPGWNTDRSEYSITLKIKRRENNKEVPHQDIYISTWCGPTDDCKQNLCRRTFRLYFTGTKW